MMRCICLLLPGILLMGCSRKIVSPQQRLLQSWTTTMDQRWLLHEQQLEVSASALSAADPVIIPDTSQRYQEIEGFGYTLTGGSAQLINAMEATAREALLEELFGKGTGSAGISFLRISIGASDLNDHAFTYNDLSAGETDVQLQHFSLAPDAELITLLRRIREINPHIPLLATPWSAPAWMKDNNSLTGGQLQLRYYDVYADYFVRYLRAMQDQGLPIQAITPQNEPLHDGNNPSMKMTAEQQRDFIRDHLGPKIRAARLSTRIIIWDHNADHPEYPLTILADTQAKSFIDGTAFHLYAGEITALAQVHQAHPDRGIYFTEQYTASNGSFGGDLEWHLRNVVIGSLRNWSRVVLEWNLANNPSFGPHTPGGCTTCKGAVTVNGSEVERNVAYYIISQISRFVPPGSVRIATAEPAGLSNVAFLRPDGKLVLLIMNSESRERRITVRLGEGYATPVLPAQSVMTLVW